LNLWISLLEIRNSGSRNIVKFSILARPMELPEGTKTLAILVTLFIKCCGQLERSSLKDKILSKAFDGAYNFLNLLITYYGCCTNTCFKQDLYRYSIAKYYYETVLR